MICFKKLLCIHTGLFTMGLPENSLAFANHVVVSFWSEMVQNGSKWSKVVSTWFEVVKSGFNWFGSTEKWFQLLAGFWSQLVWLYRKVVSTGLALQGFGLNWFRPTGIWFKLVSIRAAQSRWFGIRRQSGGPPDVQKEGPHTHAP